MRCPKCKGPTINVGGVDCGIEYEYHWDCVDDENCGHEFCTYDLEDVVKDEQE